METAAVDADAIDFSLSSVLPLQGGASRGAILDINSLKGTGFRVSAYSTGTDNWTSIETTAEPEFMHNRLVEWNSSESAWTYTPGRYWPGKVDGANYGKVSFFAWSDVGSWAIVSGNTDKGAPELTVTVPNACAEQKDLVTDVVVDETSQTVTGGVVPFAFSHVLSRIGFEAKLAKSYADATIKVTSLKINYAQNKVKNNGIYTFGNSDHNAGSWALTEAALSSMSASAEGDQMAPDVDPPALSVTATTINDPARYLMLLPQAVEAGDLKVEIDWTVTSGDGANQSTVTNTKTFGLPAVEWEQSNAYMYRLIFDLNAVEMDNTMTVTSWDITTSYQQINITYFANFGTDKKEVKHTFLNIAAQNMFTHPSAASFTGWNTEAGGGGTTYQPGETLPGSITLYAQWAP